jgi:hypothetical protein
MTIEDKLITIEELINYCKNEQLHKPSFQRDKQWKDSQNLAFLKFTFSMQHILTPFLCTKNIVQNNETLLATEMFSVFDGNNRLNALFDFERTPLKYLEDLNTNIKTFLSAKEGGEQIYHLIYNLTYTDIYNTTSLREICKSQEKYFLWYKTNDDKEDSLETAYHDLHSKIVKIKFNQIKLNLKVFSNLPFHAIVDIFTNINTSGVKLSTQDILKATCSLTFYEHHEINDFSKLLKLICKQINEQNEKELLSAPLPERHLTTFQVLFATQLYLHEEFPLIIEMPGNADMDLVFKLYQIVCPNITTKNAEAMNRFIPSLYHCCQTLQSVHNILFGIVFVERGIPLFRKVINKIVILLYHMMCNEWNFKDLVKVVLYSRLCTLLNTKDEEKAIFESKNPLPYLSASSSVDTMISLIKKSQPIGKIPSKHDLRILFEYLIHQNQNPCEFSQKKTQYKPIILEVIMINFYYYSRIPVSLHETALHLDHIIPSSLKGWTGALDINRIGNRMLIPKQANIKKSNKQITADFLEKNNMTFEYFNYITPEQYNKIVGTGDVVNHVEFQSFCEKRENTYLAGILDYLYDVSDTDVKYF